MFRLPSNLKYIALAAIIGLAVQVGITAIAFAETDEKTAIVFLLGDACKPNVIKQYSEHFKQAWVVCADYSNWIEAHQRLYGFEIEIPSVGVQPNNDLQHRTLLAGILCGFHSAERRLFHILPFTVHRTVYS